MGFILINALSPLQTPLEIFACQTPVYGHTQGTKMLVTRELGKFQVLRAVRQGTEAALTNYGRPPWET
jgi:hypothetical protein